MAIMRTYNFALSMADKMDDITKNDNSYPSRVTFFIIVAIYIAALLHYRGKTQLSSEKPDPIAATMGEREIWSEPRVLMVSDQTCKILEHAGWLQYLNILQGFHEELTLEFLQNLQNYSTVVKGISMTVSEEVMVEVTQLLAEGVKWADKSVLLYNAIEAFQDPGE